MFTSYRIGFCSVSQSYTGWCEHTFPSVFMLNMSLKILNIILMCFDVLTTYLQTVSLTVHFSTLIKNSYLYQECVYTLNFIPGWNSSREKIIPVYGEMLLLTRFCWDERQGWKKEKKTCKHFIPGWNFKMSMFFLIFDVCIQVCFPNSTCLNIMKVWI